MMPMIYKVEAKVVAIRLGPILNQVITPNQDHYDLYGGS